MQSVVENKFNIQIPFRSYFSSGCACQAMVYLFLFGTFERNSNQNIPKKAPRTRDCWAKCTRTDRGASAREPFRLNKDAQPPHH
jgi:hypothetical protein